MADRKRASECLNDQRIPAVSDGAIPASLALTEQRGNVPRALWHAVVTCVGVGISMWRVWGLPTGGRSFSPIFSVPTTGAGPTPPGTTWIRCVSPGDVRKNYWMNGDVTGPARVKSVRVVFLSVSTTLPSLVSFPPTGPLVARFSFSPRFIHPRFSSLRCSVHAFSCVFTIGISVAIASGSVACRFEARSSPRRARREIKELASRR